MAVPISWEHLRLLSPGGKDIIGGSHTADYVASTRTHHNHRQNPGQPGAACPVLTQPSGAAQPCLSLQRGGCKLSGFFPSRESRPVLQESDKGLETFLSHANTCVMSRYKRRVTGE